MNGDPKFRISPAPHHNLWAFLGSDYAANCLRWQHDAAPILPPTGDGWQSRWTANPDLLAYGGRTLLYYRGNGEIPGRAEPRDRIGVAEVLALGSGSLTLNTLNPDSFSIDVGEEAAFDGQDVLDPAAVEFAGKVFLYYSAIGAGPDSIGLAVSEDGVNFVKSGNVMPGRAPDVIVHEGRMVMVYQRADALGDYELYAAESPDGLTFTPIKDDPIVMRPPNSWDSKSITTARLAYESGWFYLMYGGSAYLADEPDYFGLARSRNLIDWEFHPGNPVFGCGAKGSPDGGAIWFPALCETEDAFILLYEGTRGKYTWDLSSAICLASLAKPTA